MKSWIIVVLAASLLGGCKLMRPGVYDCSKPAAYESASEVPALTVPEGTDLPDSRNGLRIPAVGRSAPPRSGCLDKPPEYRPTATAAAG